MKKVMLMMSLMFFSSFSYAGYWYAEAHSQSASGWAQSNNRLLAQETALRECAVRTPSWEACFITKLDWVN